MNVLTRDPVTGLITEVALVTNAGVPTYVAAGATHNVQASNQELAFYDITVDGDLLIDGDLVFV